VQITGKDFDPTHAGVFWLRLYGVLVDLPDYLVDISGSAPAMAAIEQVRAALSRDELIWTHYRRDAECHVVVDYYAPMKDNGSPRAAIRIKTLPGNAPIPWDEFNDALTRLLRAHLVRGTPVEHVLARSMAARVASPLESLRLTLFNPLTQEAARLGRPFIPSSVTPPPR
jgi:hypothetical protein